MTTDPLTCQDLASIYETSFIPEPIFLVQNLGRDTASIEHVAKISKSRQSCIKLTCYTSPSRKSTFTNLNALARVKFTVIESLTFTLEAA